MADPAKPSASSPHLGAFRFGVIVLAAGASTRMGQPKQLLPLAGQPLVVRAVEAALASSAWPVIVVLGASADLIRPLLAKHPVLVVENPAWAEGMASSLRTGIATLQQFSRSVDGAIIALCDQPGFSADVIRRLISRQQETGRSIVAAHYEGRNGVPALFLRQHFAALAALTGEEGARTLVNRSTSEVATVDLPALAVDLDTPADYAAQNPV
ncbi:nucleotidyltransferase family protein [Opitutus terrae]|uniref:MobA-like NTP transferase domain-containing protein n=1 Tax=Opitutus terrae (strain DSM 11246 / JCM 15787 / PB90-1) TaxID=452637 RepID=B1ZUF6_OPITP|nr:nucleotidyltransferase family protein [Opitutus terrae]ACB73999.1 conserved hypothetical protein [Opitutus terrae PB90-1]